MTSAEIGSAIKKRRKLLRLTQRQLAELADCSTPTVVAAEAGKATLRIDGLLAILDVLGVHVKLADNRGDL